jgi:uncharacterized protein
MEKTRTAKVLCLDGGGSKGVYTLGVLAELEKEVSKPLCECFDFIYGTSTGSIIAAMIGLGMSIDEIKKIYFSLIPNIMKCKTQNKKTNALEKYALEIFSNKKFNSFKTNIGIVALNYDTQMPLIFKTNMNIAHGTKKSFEAGFGLYIKDAVIASCSAAPIFKEKQLNTNNKGNLLAIDGGFIANNPTLFAIVDATKALNISVENLKVISIGVGNYIEKPISFTHRILTNFKMFKIVSRVLNASSNTTEILTKLLYPNLKIVRINEIFNEPKYGTNLTEKDIKKLDKMYQLGIYSYAKFEKDILNINL